MNQPPSSGSAISALTCTASSSAGTVVVRSAVEVVVVCSVISGTLTGSGFAPVVEPAVETPSELLHPTVTHSPTAATQIGARSRFALRTRNLARSWFDTW